LAQAVQAAIRLLLTHKALLVQILYLARLLLLAAGLVQPNQTLAALAVLAAVVVKIKRAALATPLP
jgi:hypothetical protein